MSKSVLKGVILGLLEGKASIDQVVFDSNEDVALGVPLLLFGVIVLDMEDKIFKLVKVGVFLEKRGKEVGVGVEVEEVEAFVTASRRDVKFSVEDDIIQAINKS